MKVIVSRYGRTGLCRILLASGLFLGSFSGIAAGATVQWAMLPDRERITVSLNKEEGFAGQVSRVDAQGLLLNLGVPPTGMKDQKAPEEARLFHMSSPRGRSVAFFIQTPAFGYIVTRPDRNTVVVDLFNDPMGARWKAPEGSAGLQPSASAQTGQEQTVPPVSSVSQNAAQSQAPASQAAKPPSAGQQAAAPAASVTPPAQPVVQARQPVATQAAPPQAAQSASRPAQAQAAQVSAPAQPVPVLPYPQANMPAPAGTRPPQAAQASARSAQAAQPVASPPQAAQAAVPAQVQAEQAQPAPTQTPQTSVVRGTLTQTSGAQAAASRPEGNATQDRPYYSVPYVFRGRINLGGPSDESGVPPQPAAQAAPPASQAASSTQQAAAPPSGTSRTANATGGRPPAQAGEAKANATLAAANATVPERVVYVDEKGNPVEPPADPVQVLAAVRRDMSTGNMQAAYEQVAKLLNHPELSREQREEVLHLNAELLFATSKDKLAANYDRIVSATQEAINYNQSSPRNAGALLRLGYTNLQVNNPSYATAYFNMLRRQFPKDESIPLTYYYWGEYHYNRNEMQLASDQFQYVVQHFSESNYAREAALGLARSYTQLGYYPQAFQVMDYIERRWPRFYLDYPPVLEMMGDIGFRMGNLDYALSRYWTFYNIVPDSPSADVILTRIGDVYTRKKQLPAAKEVYTESARRFPDKDGGLVAAMRLAEEGINDTPTIADMFSVFEKPFSLRPSEVYHSIITQHPKSPLMPLAQLKLAMWQMWNKRFEDAIKLCSDLIAGSPDSELVPRAKDLALKAFAVMAAEAIYQKRSAGIQEIWNKYPIVKNQEEALSPESRVALAVSLRDQGNPDKALDVIAPFFLGAKIPEYSEMAMSLALDIALAHDQWKSIEDIARKVELWQLTESSQRQLDYALALALENQNKSEEAAPFWKKLHDQGALSGPQKAYSEYFLARDAENRRDLKDAYQLGREALTFFLQQAKDNPDQADTGKVISQLSSLMDITEKAGRLNEARQYAQQYQQYLKPQDAESQRLALRIAQLHKRQGDTAAWRKTLTELSRDFPDSFYGRMAASELRGERLAEDAAQFSSPGSQ